MTVILGQQQGVLVRRASAVAAKTAMAGGEAGGAVMEVEVVEAMAMVAAVAVVAVETVAARTAETAMILPWGVRKVFGVVDTVRRSACGRGP